MLKTRIVLAVTFVLLALVPAHAQNVDALMTRTPDELQKGIENSHPAAYFVLAQKLFEDDRKDDAVFWFYAGQLRFRFHLAVKGASLDPSGDPALFGSLFEVIGRPVNEYAFGDLDELVETYDRVLDWDEKTANGFTSKSSHEKKWLETREGLRGLRQHVTDNKDSIREQRAANGLENRR